MKRLVILNSTSGVLLFAVNLVISFLLSPVIVRELGDRGYGVWEIFLSVFGYLSILELGVGPAFIRFVARAAAQEDREELDAVMSATFLLLTGAGFLGLLVACVIAGLPERLLNIDPAQVPEARLLAVLLGGNFLLQMTGTVFTAYLMGMQRHYVMNATRVLLTVAQAAATYLALTRWPGSGLIWLSVILLGANLAQFSFFALWSLLRRPAPSIDPRRVRRSTVGDLYRFGVKSVTLMAAARVAQGSVPIIMGWVLGAGQVVYYAIPNRLVGYAAGLGTALGFPLMPYFSALDGKGDRAETLSAWFSFTRALQFVMIGMAVGTFLLGGPFIARWIGPNYAAGGAWVIRFLAAGLLVEALAPNASRLLVSMNRHGRPAAAGLVIAVLGVPVIAFLASARGVAGVGLAVFLVKAGMESAWFVIAARALGLGIGEHLRRTILRFIPSALLFAATVLALRHLREAETYPLILAYAAAGGLLYAGSSWRIALTAAERSAGVGALGGLRGRFRAGREA